MKVKKAIITAGGEGTRLLPCSAFIPKEMFPISNIPAIDFAINECVAAEISEIFIVVSEKKELLVKYLSYKQINEPNLKTIKICFVPQCKGRGTAKAIESCRKFIGKEPFFVIFPDEIVFESKATGLSILSAFDTSGKSVLGLKPIPQKECRKYGIISYDKISKTGLYEITDVVEKPEKNAPSNLALCGRYIFSPEIFEILEKISLHGKEYFLTDAIKKLAKLGKVCGYELTEKIYDAGNPRDYVAAQKAYLDYLDKSVEKELKTGDEEIIQRKDGGLL